MTIGERKNAGGIYSPKVPAVIRFTKKHKMTRSPPKAAAALPALLSLAVLLNSPPPCSAQQRGGNGNGNNNNFYLQDTYQDRGTYRDRFMLDSPYNLCRDPLMQTSNVTATSEASQRSSNEARLWGGSAWTAEYSDFQQVIIRGEAEGGFFLLFSFFAVVAFAPMLADN